jgi:hypothetical protein
VRRLAFPQRFAPNILRIVGLAWEIYMTEPLTPLPKAPILSYLSNISTPTRVRLIAARGILVLAVLCLLLFAFVFIWNASHLHAEVRWFAYDRSRSPTLQDYVNVCWNIRRFFTIFLFDVILVFTPGVILAILPRPVRAGRKVPCILAMTVVIPLVVVFALATLYIFCKTFVDIFNAVPRPDYSYAPWFLTAPIGVLGIVLLKDLCVILHWIARNPTVEKTPTPFLPGASRPSTKV